MDLFLAILPLVMVGASTVVSVYLFVSLKREIHGSETRREATGAKLVLELEELTKRTQQLERELPERCFPGSPAMTAGMDLAKRSQALRRIRQGEGPEQIAAALSLPRKEVELLLKVNQLVAELNGSTS